MKFVKEFVIPAVVLTVICVVISAVLAFTYNTTKPIIEAAAQREADLARMEVLPKADRFEEVKVSGLSGLLNAYRATNGAGYVFTSFAKGYGGPLHVMTGITTEGIIVKVKLMDNNETPGLGSKTGDADYTSQYEGKDSDLDGISAISGATISSTAFRTAVSIAFEAYSKLEGVELDIPAASSPEEQVFPGIELTEISVAGAQRAYDAGEAGWLLVTTAEGYGGTMEVYTGIGPDGKIVMVALGTNSETPGIGSKTGDAAYTGQYAGQESLDGITAISGATISSKAFQKAVQNALDITANLTTFSSTDTVAGVDGEGA